MHQIVIYLLIIVALPLNWGIGAFDLTEHSLVVLRSFSAIVLWPLFFALPRRALKGFKLHMVLLILIVSTQQLVLSIQPMKGLPAEYFANTSLSPPMANEWRYSALEHSTRIDHRIDFSGTGFSLRNQEFPLYFLNDNSRFRHNPISDAQFEQRWQFLFSARWDGFISVPASVTSLELRASAGVIKLIIDGQAVTGNSDHGVSMPVTPGIHGITISYRRTSHEHPSLQLGWIEGQQFNIVPERYLAPAKTDFSRQNFATASTLLALFVMAYLTYLVWRQLRGILWQQVNWERLLLWLFFACAATAALFRVMDSSGDFANLIFLPGDDWTRYETQARNILFGDWLDQGSTSGQVFFVNVLYRYIVAALHLIAGENPIAVIWVQQLCMYLFLVGFYLSIHRLYGVTTAALALLLSLLLRQLTGFADVLLDTTFSIIFAYAAVVAMVFYKRSPTRVAVLLSASALGIAISLRGNFLPFAGLALVWLGYANWKNSVPWHKYLLLYALLIILPLSFIGLRNYAVVGEFRMMPSSGGFNFWLAHSFTEFTEFAWQQPERPEDQAIFSETLRMIAEDPGALLRRSYLKLLCLAGFDVYDNFDPVRRILIPHIMCLLSLIYLWLSRFRRDELLLYTGWIASVWLALILIFPWGYGWRLSASTFPFVYLIIAMSVCHLAGRIKSLLGARRYPQSV